YTTGMRFGEIVGLTWDRVKLREGYLDLRAEDTKTREPRKVYIVPQVREVLDRLGKVRALAHSFVFTYHGRPVKEIKKALKRACKETDIGNFRFHDLRHTFTTNMRKAGVDRTVIMKLTGHKTLSMFLRYSAVDENDGREAVEKLENYLDSVQQFTAKSLQAPKKG
ncbi:MAG: site-specific integrase, partial [Deltaproteobacteria bacterium]|nr:site-specific integrase [Deltaproteobacteria bacterium]